MAPFWPFMTNKNCNGKSIQPILWVLTFYPCKFQGIYTSNKEIPTKTGYWHPQGRPDRQTLNYKTPPWHESNCISINPLNLKHLALISASISTMSVLPLLPSFNDNFLSPSATINYLQLYAMSVYGHQKNWKHSWC